MVRKLSPTNFINIFSKTDIFFGNFITFIDYIYWGDISPKAKYGESLDVPSVDGISLFVA